MSNIDKDKIPISVLVVTKDEEARIGRCLDSISDFAEIIVIDSYSVDQTQKIAKKYGANVVEFGWNHAYPKKRQWCIDTLNIGHDWILWLDADEALTTEFVEEVRNIAKNNWQHCGYFISSGYIFNNKLLKHGLKNNKLAIYNRSMIEFPEVDDLDIEGMGEIEGHYQPVKKAGYEDMKIGQIKAPILHYAYEDEADWWARHIRYACWEAQMIMRGAYPKDPVFWRESLKKLTRKSCLRPVLMFLYSYIFRLGFLDRREGLDFALSRKAYCDMVLKVLGSLKTKK